LQLINNLNLNPLSLCVSAVSAQKSTKEQRAAAALPRFWNGLLMRLGLLYALRRSDCAELN
jgi:hypothetical protein